MNNLSSNVVNGLILLGSLVIAVLGVSGAALMILKIFVFVSLPAWKGTMLENINIFMQNLDQVLSAMTYFKIAVPTFFSMLILMFLNKVFSYNRLVLLMGLKQVNTKKRRD